LCIKLVNYWDKCTEMHVHETATYRCDDTRGCVMQFWPPDDEHMCSKHVEAWNKLIVKQKFCASSWLITEINASLCNKCSQNVNISDILSPFCNPIVLWCPACAILLLSPYFAHFYSIHITIFIKLTVNPWQFTYFFYAIVPFHFRQQFQFNINQWMLNKQIIGQWTKNNFKIVRIQHIPSDRRSLNMLTWTSCRLHVSCEGRFV